MRSGKPFTRMGLVIVVCSKRQLRSLSLAVGIGGQKAPRDEKLLPFRSELSTILDDAGNAASYPFNPSRRAGTTTTRLQVGRKCICPMRSVPELPSIEEMDLDIDQAIKTKLKNTRPAIALAVLFKEPENDRTNYRPKTSALANAVADLPFGNQTSFPPIYMLDFDGDRYQLHVRGGRGVSLGYFRDHHVQQQHQIYNTDDLKAALA